MVAVDEYRMAEFSASQKNMKAFGFKAQIVFVLRLICFQIAFFLTSLLAVYPKLPAISHRPIEWQSIPI